MADFVICQNVPDFILVTGTHLFFIRFLQIWYQNIKAGGVSAPPDLLYFAVF